MCDILCEFPGRNFVSGLHTLKPKKTLNTFSKNLVFFFQPWPRLVLASRLPDP